MHAAILASVAITPLGYNVQYIKQLYESFYNDTYNYLNSAYWDARDTRRFQVEGRKGGFFNSQRYTRDNKTGIDLTDWWAYVSHPIDIFYNRPRFLSFKICYLHLRQIGLIRMFQLYNSMVRNYNKVTGSQLPEIKSYEEGGFVDSVSRIESEQATYPPLFQKLGYGSNPGIRHGFYDPLTADILNGPIFYEHSKYEHGSNWSKNGVPLTVGQYKNLDEIQSLKNNSLSSVKVPRGWKVTLFDQVDFKGQQKVLIRDSESLSDFNDKTCSLIVEIDLTHEYHGLRI